MTSLPAFGRSVTAAMTGRLGVFCVLNGMGGPTTGR